MRVDSIYSSIMMYNSLLYKYYHTLHKEIHVLPSTNTVLLREHFFAYLIILMNKPLCQQTFKSCRSLDGKEQ